jgi:Neuraminidase (sialidase)
VFVAAMNEEGGGLTTRQNVMYRSTDGGTTWTSVTMGGVFSAVGDGVCASNSYFAKINPIWRHMGWGEPGVGPNQVVHYVYAAKGALSTGDIFYQRSTDNGVTWSAPVLLNDPETNQFQSHWMPSLSVNYSPGSFNQPKAVTVSWYDRRQASTSCNTATDPGCSYQRFGVQSNDNGATWGANFAVSDQIIPQPTQNNGLVQSCYAGDYDYSTALNNNAYVTWTDGRVSVSGAAVQSVEGDVVPEP